MALYSYKCPAGHSFELCYPIGTAPSIGDQCRECTRPLHRDFETDLRSMTFRNDDPWRKAYLSSENEKALGERGRALDPNAPKDMYDARYQEQNHGRKYILNDSTVLDKYSQQALKDHGTLT